MLREEINQNASNGNIYIYVIICRYSAVDGNNASGSTSNVIERDTQLKVH